MIYNQNQNDYSYLIEHAFELLLADLTDNIYLTYSDERVRQPCVRINLQSANEVVTPGAGVFEGTLALIVEQRIDVQDESLVNQVIQKLYCGAPGTQALAAVLTGLLDDFHCFEASIQQTQDDYEPQERVRSKVISIRVIWMPRNN